MNFTLTSADMMGSVLQSMAPESGIIQKQSYSAYGDTVRSVSNASLPGFNGERRDPLTGTTHLGNGYRALLRFHCPDNMSPFGDGGINCYAYCSSDPINRSDPSGHMDRLPGEGRGKKQGLMGLLTDALPGGDMAIAAIRGMRALSSAGASTAREASKYLKTTKNMGMSRSIKKSRKVMAKGASGRVVDRPGKKTLTRTRNVAQLAQSTNMMDLPDEMLRHVASFLPRDESVGHFNQVNRRLRDITMDMRLTPTEHVMERTRNIPHVRSKQQEAYFSSLGPDRQMATTLKNQMDIAINNLPEFDFAGEAHIKLVGEINAIYDTYTSDPLDVSNLVIDDDWYSNKQ